MQVPFITSTIGQRYRYHHTVLLAKGTGTITQCYWPKVQVPSHSDIGQRYRHHHTMLLAKGTGTITQCYWAKVQVPSHSAIGQRYKIPHPALLPGEVTDVLTSRGKPMLTGHTQKVQDSSPTGISQIYKISHTLLQAECRDFLANWGKPMLQVSSHSYFSQRYLQDSPNTAFNLVPSVGFWEVFWIFLKNEHGKVKGTLAGEEKIKPYVLDKSALT